MTASLINNRFRTSSQCVCEVIAPRGQKCEVCGLPIYRNFPCYLVFSKRDDGFPIGGEGDLIHRECLEVKG